MWGDVKDRSNSQPPPAPSVPPPSGTTVADWAKKHNTPEWLLAAATQGADRLLRDRNIPETDYLAAIERAGKIEVR